MERKSDADTKWPTALWVGIGLSVLWFAVLVVYCASPSAKVPDSSQWHEFWTSDPANFGNALAGVFAPLAFLWLVVATFLQRSELEQNRAALHLQADELRNSVDQLKLQTDIFAGSRRSETELATNSELEQRLNQLATYLFDRLEPIVLITGLSHRRLLNTTPQLRTEWKNNQAFDDMLNFVSKQLTQFNQAFDTALLPSQQHRPTRSGPIEVFDVALRRIDGLLALAEHVRDSSAYIRAFEAVELPTLRTQLVDARDKLKSLRE